MGKASLHFVALEKSFQPLYKIAKLENETHFQCLGSDHIIQQY